MRIRATSRVVAFLASGGLEAGRAVVGHSSAPPLGCAWHRWDKCWGKVVPLFQLSIMAMPSPNLCYNDSLAANIPCSRCLFFPLSFRGILI